MVGRGLLDRPGRQVCPVAAAGTARMAVVTVPAALVDRPGLLYLRVLVVGAGTAALQAPTMARTGPLAPALAELGVRVAPVVSQVETVPMEPPAPAVHRVPTDPRLPRSARSHGEGGARTLRVAGRRVAGAPAVAVAVAVVARAAFL